MAGNDNIRSLEQARRQRKAAPFHAAYRELNTALTGIHARHGAVAALSAFTYLMCELIRHPSLPTPMKQDIIQLVSKTIRVQRIKYRISYAINIKIISLTVFVIGSLIGCALT